MKIKNQTTTKEKIPRKSIHFDDAIYYDGVHYFVKTLKHLTEAELLGTSYLAALCKQEYQFYGCTKNTYDTNTVRMQFSENWILVKHLMTKKEKDMIIETT